MSLARRTWPLLAATALLGGAPATADVKTLALKPSASSAGAFAEPSYVLFDARASKSAPLVVFLPGTGGRPANSAALLNTVAAQGYRVIGLEYDDEPAVAQVCPKDPDPACSEAFRQMRIDAAGASKHVSNPPREAIVPRLVTALKTMADSRPDESWSQYLDGDQPRWIASSSPVFRRARGWPPISPSSTGFAASCCFPAPGT